MMNSVLWYFSKKNDPPRMDSRASTALKISFSADDESPAASLSLSVDETFDTLSDDQMLEEKIRSKYELPEKPPFSLEELCKMAVRNSEQKRCSKFEIDEYIIASFDYYKNHPNPSSWQWSLLEAMRSADKVFVKIPPDKGNVHNDYAAKWTLREFATAAEIKTDQILREIRRKHKDDDDDEKPDKDKEEKAKKKKALDCFIVMMYGVIIGLLLTTGIKSFQEENKKMHCTHSFSLPNKFFGTWALSDYDTAGLAQKFEDTPLKVKAHGAYTTMTFVKGSNGTYIQKINSSKNFTKNDNEFVSFKLDEEIRVNKNITKKFTYSPEDSDVLTETTKLEKHNSYIIRKYTILSKYDADLMVMRVEYSDGRKSKKYLFEKI